MRVSRFGASDAQNINVQSRFNQSMETANAKAANTITGKDKIFDEFARNLV